jgi:hypothetical protein
MFSKIILLSTLKIFIQNLLKEIMGLGNRGMVIPNFIHGYFQNPYRRLIKGDGSMIMLTRSELWKN